MEKLKIPALTLLTLALLIIGAFLPDIAAVGQDRVIADRSGFGDMESIKLELSNPESVEALLQKLTLVRDGDFYIVSPGKTRIGQGGIEQAVKDSLALYHQAELIPDRWQGYEFSAAPHLVYNERDRDTYAVLWVITIHWPDLGENLSLFVDDETGRILYLHFDSADVLNTYTQQGYLDTLSGVYFASTGLSELIADPQAFGVDGVAFEDVGLRAKGDKYYCYFIQHPEQGVLELQFWLYERGFYVLIR